MSVTDVVEFTFCPFFTYFGKILELKQFEHRRGTVLAGRSMHQKYEKYKDYIPRNIIGLKHTGLVLYSENMRLVGKIDEIIETDKEIILIERKYSDSVVIWNTHLVQIGLLSCLLEENFKKPITKAIMIFQKNNRKMIEIEVNPEIIGYAKTQLKLMNEIIMSAKLPFSEFDSRCLDCTYRRICPVGSLNTS